MVIDKKLGKYYSDVVGILIPIFSNCWSAYRLRLRPHLPNEENKERKQFQLVFRTIFAVTSLA